jgi:DNA-binding transcriptional MerR regulator
MIRGVQLMSNKKPTEYISLREAGKRLGIPPSTIVYYKDRFEGHLPRGEGSGRRKRYPAEILEVFREIRAMYDRNMTSEQIEERLAGRPDIGAETAASAQAGVGDAAGEERGEMMRQLAGVLERMSGLMEGHKAFQTEIESLRREVSRLRKDRRDLERASEERIRTLEEQIELLRLEKDEMQRFISDRAKGDGAFRSRPSRLFMNLPLVIRSSQGEYLGVTGRSRNHFTLHDLLQLIKRNVREGNKIDFHWEREEDGWILKVSSEAASSGKDRDLLFSLGEMTTPSKNLVVRLRRMVVDGNTVPETMLLGLFKKIKDSFS